MTLEENTNRNLQSELCKSAIPLVEEIRKVTSLSTRSAERFAHRTHAMEHTAGGLRVAVSESGEY